MDGPVLRYSTPKTEGESQTLVFLPSDSMQLFWDDHLVKHDPFKFDESVMVWGDPMKLSFLVSFRSDSLILDQLGVNFLRQVFVRMQ